MAGKVSKVQQVIQQARTLFLNTARTNSIADPGFAADLERLKQLVNGWLWQNRVLAVAGQLLTAG